MKSSHQKSGKCHVLSSILIAVVLIIGMVATPISAAVPTGPFVLSYTAGENGFLVGSVSQIVELGGSGTEVTAVPETGYHFVDWSDGSVVNPRTDTNVTSDVYVTANFAIDVFTLSYSAGAGGTLTGDTSQTVEYDKDGTPVTAVPDTGYHFEEWNDNLRDNPRTDCYVYCDIDVMAFFAVDTFTLDYSPGPNGSITGERWQTVDYGADGSAVTAVPDTGYHFTEWSDGTTENPRTDTNVTEDVEVTAIFSANTYTLTYTAGANGSLSGDTTQTVDYEAQGTEVTAIANAGYQFTQWSDGSTENPRIDDYVTDHIEVTAYFAFLHTVTFDAQGGSTVPNQLVVAGGKVGYPDAPAKSGFYFAGWYKEASCENIWHTNMDLVSSDTTLYAKWNETAPKVAILYGNPEYADVQAKLVSTGFFSQVDLISLRTATPTLSLLKQYNAVFIYTDSSAYTNPAEWGNALADYVDAGGGVVMAGFVFVPPDGSMGIDGRIRTDGYLPFTQDPQSSGYNLTLVGDVPADPLLNGVNSFDGGTRSFHCTVSLTSGATLIAHWSNDYPLIATKQGTAGRVAGLNFFPISSDVREDLWASSTDGAHMMANALVWVASTGATTNPPTITSDGGGELAYLNAEENQTAVTTVTAIDPDNTVLTYSISGGIDADQFEIDSTSGVLTFKTAPDFEYPINYYLNNIYQVIVQASDGELVDSQHLFVTVTNASNEAPVITNDGGDSTVYMEVKESETAVTTLTADDPDGDTLTWRISDGLDAALFVVDSTSGVLAFIAAPDFDVMADANSDGTYEVTVEVSDGTLTDTQAISVKVTPLTSVDLLTVLKLDIYDLQSEGILSSSTANGLARSVQKAIDKINASDDLGALKLLNALITSINRQTPKKIPVSESADLVAQIDQVIAMLRN